MVRRAIRFPDITQWDLRLVNRMTGRLVEASDLESLGLEMIAEIGSVLPADCMVWNRWTTQMDEMLDYAANDRAFEIGLTRYADALAGTIHHHPVIAAGAMDRAWDSPQRTTDYQIYGNFKSNPLFQEVYRHLDSHFQIAYNVVKLEDSLVILSWNMKHRDFTDREVQLLHLTGLRLGVLSRRLEEKRRLSAMWNALAGSIGPAFHSAPGALPMLHQKDGQIMSALVRGESRMKIARRLHWRRDTLDRYLAELREKAGYENMPQFLRALADLKPGSPAP